MMKFSKSGTALAVALALTAGGAGAAVSLSGATTSGGSVILWSEAGGVLAPTPSISPAPAAAPPRSLKEYFMLNRRRMLARRSGLRAKKRNFVPLFKGGVTPRPPGQCSADTDG